eukprot:5599088-Pyramimonas_sp.AAC.1
MSMPRPPNMKLAWGTTKLQLSMEAFTHVRERLIRNTHVGEENEGGRRSSLTYLGDGSAYFPGCVGKVQGQYFHPIRVTHCLCNAVQLVLPSSNEDEQGSLSKHGLRQALAEAL